MGVPFEDAIMTQMESTDDWELYLPIMREFAKDYGLREE